jgi:hypothetical protein
MAEKTYSQQLVELSKYRKLLTKAFKENETGDVYQLTTFTLEYGSRQLTATLVLASHPAYKLSVPMPAFRAMFTAVNEDTHRDFENAASS